MRNASRARSGWTAGLLAAAFAAVTAAAPAQAQSACRWATAVTTGERVYVCRDAQGLWRVTPPPAAGRSAPPSILSRQPNEPTLGRPRNPGLDAEIVAARERNREVQQALNVIGCQAGGPDGVWGARSARAARCFQREIGARATGYLTPEEERQLLAVAAQVGSGAAAPLGARDPEAEALGDPDAAPGEALGEASDAAPGDALAADEGSDADGALSEEEFGPIRREALRFEDTPVGDDRFEEVVSVEAAPPAVERILDEAAQEAAAQETAARETAARETAAREARARAERAAASRVAAPETVPPETVPPEIAAAAPEAAPAAAAAPAPETNATLAGWIGLEPDDLDAACREGMRVRQPEDSAARSPWIGVFNRVCRAHAYAIEDAMLMLGYDARLAAAGDAEAQRAMERRRAETEPRAAQ